MEILLKWFVLASVQLAATMSPGPAFVVAVRNAMVHTRSVGIFTALGLSLGVAAHVCFVLAGISLLIANSVVAFTVIRYAGAAYLFYIGIKALRTKKKPDAEHIQEVSEGYTECGPANKKPYSAAKAILTGFLTNLLNPKAVVFFTAVYAQFIDPATPFPVHVLYGCTSVAIEFLWFSGVAIILTNNMIKQRFMRVMHWVERCCGGLMVGLGVKLALSK